MKLDSFIYLILIAVFAIGITLSFTTSTHPPHSSHFKIKFGSEVLKHDTLLTEVEYSLLFDNLAPDEECFWQVKKRGSNENVKSIYFQNLTHTFTDTGDYHIQAFYSQKKAVDTVLTVMPGLKADFAFDIRAFHPQEEIEFVNNSKGAAEYSWFVVDENSDTLKKMTNPEFSWLPELAGDYQVSLIAMTENGKQKQFTETLKVTDKPIVNTYEPKKTTSRVVKKNPAPPKPKKSKRDDSGNFAVGFTPKESLNIGPGAPDKNGVEYRTGNTKIEIKPAQTLRIGSISYWGNIDQPGGYNYSIKCTSCTNSEQALSRNSSTTKDFAKPQTQKIRYPGGIALLPGETYTLTIQTLNETPCLGFFTPTDRTIISNEMGSISFLSNSSCVFDLTLEKN